MRSELRLNADAYIGLGANLGTPRKTFENSLDLISQFANLEKVSRLYQSAPFGFSEQPPFVNSAAHIKTELSPTELLTKLQEVEKKLGKKFICENGPRIIDLDLLIYGELSLETEDLIIPHPGILSRDFVLLPLFDLNPELSHPDWGVKTLKSALGGLQKRFIEDNPEDWNYPN